MGLRAYLADVALYGHEARQVVVKPQIENDIAEKGLAFKRGLDTHYAHLHTHFHVCMYQHTRHRPMYVHS